MAKKRMGRPPAGPGGQRTSEYPARTIRLPEPLLRQLDVLASLRGVSASSIVNEALEGYFRELAAGEKAILEQTARLRRKG